MWKYPVCVLELPVKPFVTEESTQGSLWQSAAVVMLALFAQLPSNPEVEQLTCVYVHPWPLLKGWVYVAWVETVSVKAWVAFGEKPLLAVITMGKVPADVDVPLSEPDDEKVTPPGRLPLSLKVGAGYPVAVTWNDPAEL